MEKTRCVTRIYASIAVILLSGSVFGYGDFDEGLHYKKYFVNDEENCDDLIVHTLNDIACSFEKDFCCWYSEGGSDTAVWMLSNTTINPDIPIPKEGDGFLLLVNSGVGSTAMGLLWSPRFNLSSKFTTLSLSVYCGEDEDEETNLELYLSIDNDGNPENTQIDMDDDDICDDMGSWRRKNFSFENLDNIENFENKVLRVMLHGTVNTVPLALKDLTLFADSDVTSSVTWTAPTAKTSQTIISTITGNSSFSADVSTSKLTNEITTATSYNTTTPSTEKSTRKRTSTTTTETPTAGKSSISVSVTENFNVSSFHSLLTTTTKDETTFSNTYEVVYNTTTQVSPSATTASTSDGNTTKISESSVKSSTFVIIETTTDGINTVTDTNITSLTTSGSVTSSAGTASAGKSSRTTWSSSSPMTKTEDQQTTTAETLSKTETSSASDHTPCSTPSNKHEELLHAEMDVWQIALLSAFVLFAVFALSVAIINLAMRLNRRKKQWVLRKGVTSDPIFKEDNFQFIRMKVFPNK